MPDVRTMSANSYAFVDNWNGTGQHVFGFPDGSCMKIEVTTSMAALAMAEIAAFVAHNIRLLKDRRPESGARNASSPK